MHRLGADCHLSIPICVGRAHVVYVQLGHSFILGFCPAARRCVPYGHCIVCCSRATPVEEPRHPARSMPWTLLQTFLRTVATPRLPARTRTTPVTNSAGKVPKGAARRLSNRRPNSRSAAAPHMAAWPSLVSMTPLTVTPQISHCSPDPKPSQIWSPSRSEG